MVENFKKIFGEKFSNGPKVKMIIGVVGIFILLILVASISLRKNVTIIVDGEKQELKTYKSTVKDILSERGIQLSLKDKVKPALNKKISKKDIIEIKKAVEVEVYCDSKLLTITTAEDTIGDMLKEEDDTLKEQGVVFNEDIDEVTPSLDTEIEENIKVKLVNVEVLNEVTLELINYETVMEEDNNLEVNTEEVRQTGVNGEKEITYKIIKKDGKEVQRDIIKSKVIKAPINEIIAQGTKKVLASRGGDIEYKNIIYCQSTAYYSGEVTATGTAPVYNPNGISTIAVDPRVIPLGSLVYVEGYGQAIAADTGGAIQGNIIDVFLHSYDAAINWGRKYDVPVYILAYPGEW